MLAFARKPRVEPRVVNVNDVVRGVEGLLHRIIGGTAPRCAARPGAAPVLIIRAARTGADELAVKRTRCMPRGGSLIISTGTVDISEEEVRRRPVSRPDAGTIEVADTGVGMDAERLPAFSNRFLHTKEPGKARSRTGRCATESSKQANGFSGARAYRVSARPHGAPAGCNRCARAGRPPRSVLRTQPADHDGSDDSGVEDEPVVRRFVAQVLQEAGHLVRSAGTPAKGLRWQRTPACVRPARHRRGDAADGGGVTLAERIRTHQPPSSAACFRIQDPRVSIEGRVSLLPNRSRRAAAATWKICCGSIESESR